MNNKQLKDFLNFCSEHELMESPFEYALNKYENYLYNK